MAKAPKVQSLDKLMAELQPGYAGQKKVIGQQIANTDETYKATDLALDAAKTEGFNQINEQATGKGLAFGGVPIQEQADYLSTKYLPGKQAAKAQQQSDTLKLQGDLALLDTDIRNRAFSSRDTQIASVNQWNLQQASLEAQAKQAALDRQLTASENAKNRAAQAAEGAAGRAASAPKKVEPKQAALAIISQGLGGDGFVSPSTFQIARDMYVQAGGKASDFASQFWKYTGANSGQPNQSNWKSYYYG